MLTADMKMSLLEQLMWRFERAGSRCVRHVWLKTKQRMWHGRCRMCSLVGLGKREEGDVKEGGREEGGWEGTERDSVE